MCAWKHLTLKTLISFSCNIRSQFAVFVNTKFKTKVKICFFVEQQQQKTKSEKVFILISTNRLTKNKFITMAVPFYVPDDRENGSSSQPHSTTTSATQTPLQSPTNEHLVQVFYEALSLYSASLVLRKYIKFSFFFWVCFS